MSGSRTRKVEARKFAMQVGEDDIANHLTGEHDLRSDIARSRFTSLGQEGESAKKVRSHALNDYAASSVVNASEQTGHTSFR